MYLRDQGRHEQERKEAAETVLKKMLIEAEESGVSKSASIDDVFERVKARLHSEGHELRA